jgi:hypothetical protein
MGDRDGCLCIGCLEKRIGRMTPADFPDHPFKVLPGTPDYSNGRAPRSAR